jgi:adenylosuccinate lyase
MCGLLAADKRITAHMKPEDIDKLLEPVAYTGHCARGAARAWEAAKKLH